MAARAVWLYPGQLQQGAYSTTCQWRRVFCSADETELDNSPANGTDTANMAYFIRKAKSHGVEIHAMMLENQYPCEGTPWMAAGRRLGYC